jgi:hypothetical protein
MGSWVLVDGKRRNMIGFSSGMQSLVKLTTKKERLERYTRGRGRYVEDLASP